MMNWNELSADYALYHKTPGNQICHSIGIPLIMLALIRWTLIPGTMVPALAVLLPIYFAWRPALGAAMTVQVAAMSYAAAFLSISTALALFIGGWILQLAGHRYFEGNDPAFSKSLIHLLVGPAWILNKWLRLTN